MSQVTEAAILGAINVAVREACCGGTNWRCSDKRPVVGLTGCEKCGHSGGCHA